MSLWNFDILKEIPESFLLKYNKENVFYHPVLLKVWLETYKSLRSHQSIFIKGISENNEVFLPLVLWKRNWKNVFMRTIVAVGNSDYDYHNPVFKTQPSEYELDKFWIDLIAFLRTNFKFDNISISGITNNYVGVSDSWAQNEVCPWLDLKDLKNDDDLMKFFNTSLRGDIRRQIRRLGEMGELSMKEFGSWCEIPDETFKQFILLHSQRWPRSYKAPHFHENLLNDGLKIGLVHFSVLQCGEVEIAWHLGFEDQWRYYYYMPATNGDFYKFSPGKIHLYFLVKRAMEKGLELFDHLRGEENYKAGWSNGYQHVHTLEIRNHGAIAKIKSNILSLRKRLI